MENNEKQAGEKTGKDVRSFSVTMKQAGGKTRKDVRSFSVTMKQAKRELLLGRSRIETRSAEAVMRRSLLLVRDTM